MIEIQDKKPEVEGTDKEESVSLKGNREVKNDAKEIARKKRAAKKIALENIDLGTKPINISLSKYDFLNYYNLSPSMKNRIKMISIIIVVFILFFILFILKGKFHHQYDNEMNENNNFINQNSPIKANSFSNNKNFSNPSVSSNQKGGLI